MPLTASSSSLAYSWLTQAARKAQHDGTVRLLQCVKLLVGSARLNISRYTTKTELLQQMHTVQSDEMHIV